MNLTKRLAFMLSYAMVITFFFSMGHAADATPAAASSPTSNPTVTPVLPGNCITNKMGEVICGAGQCLTDSHGEVVCNKTPGGSCVTDNHGQVVCGAGQCLTDFHGEVVCSKKPGGACAKDIYGAVKCQ